MQQSDRGGSRSCRPAHEVKRKRPILGPGGYTSNDSRNPDRAAGTDGEFLMSIVFLVLVGILVLGGLVALGMGHRHWNVWNVAAAILLLLAATGYLVLGSWLAVRERSWNRTVSDLEVRLARARDGLERRADGRLDRIPGQRSLPELTRDRDRWQRALDAADTWKGPHWRDANFVPKPGGGPEGGAGTGELTLPISEAGGAAPFGKDQHIFLFDARPLGEGGRYLGEFVVMNASTDEADGRHRFDVRPADPAASPETAMVENVSVFDDLPVDRWIAFYRTATEESQRDDRVMPEPTRVADVEAELGVGEGTADPQVRGLVEQFVTTFQRHEREVPADEWTEAAEALARGVSPPGTFWAEVEFSKAHDFGTAAGGEFQPGERARFDLQTALELQDTATAARIVRVVELRPLTDPMAALYGRQVRDPVGEDDPGVRIDGIVALQRALRDEIGTLERSAARLATAIDTAAGQQRETLVVRGELEEDLAVWQRDVDASERLEKAFSGRLTRVRGERQAAEEAVVALGEELTAAMGRLTEEIDQAAPPPVGR
jgi:hypothetical protein